MRKRRFLLPLLLALLLSVLFAQPVLAAVTISRAELNSGRLRVEGSGATPNATMTVDGIPLGNADGGGNFRLETNNFSSPTCRITVSDGATSAQANLSGCTPAPTPTPPPTGGLTAPTLVAPANSAAVVQPFFIVWSTVANATAYNFEISSDPTFAGNVYQFIGGANAPTTQAAISGFVNGTYYWRVLAATSGNPVVVSPFSAVGSFVVTGNDPAVLPAPTMLYPTTGVQIHPLELLIVRWSSVPGVATYLLEMDDEPGFFLPGGYLSAPNIPATRTDQGFAVADPKTLYLRVRAIAADGTRGLPSATQQVVISYNAPLPPPVTLLAPANGATTNLPITFDWSDVPNNQTDGYELQIDDDPGFPGGAGSIELQVSPISISQYTLNSLPAGTHYWRVRSSHGASAPNVGAFSAYSEVRSFVIPATGGPALVSFTTSAPSAFSGQVIPFNDPTATVQLNAPAPAGGTVVTLVSSNPAVLAMPATVTVPEGQASIIFRITPGQVEVDTPVVLSATVGSTTLTANFTVQPSSLKRLDIGTGIGTLTVLGGSVVAGNVTLNGQAPAGAAINLSSSNPAAATAPAILNPVAGNSFGNFAITTNNVAALSPVTLSATWRGATVQASFTVAPNVAPTLLTPADGAAFAVTQFVNFDWNDLPGASTYTIQVDTDSAFAAPILIQLTETGSQQILGQAALPQGTLFWRVRGEGFGVVTPWSVARSFQFGADVSPTPTPPPTADTVAIQQAEYRQSRRRLDVQATSTNANVTMQIFVTSTNQLIGTLSNNGGGRYSASFSSVATNPQNITVRSSGGGAASRAVTVK